MNTWREVPCTIPERGKILPIHYALGSDALTYQSKKIIDTHLLSKLKDNKNRVVEIGSHTDAQGGDAFNLDLSERRAKKVVEYLMSKGISESRLIAVGYGETQLLNNCDNQANCSDQKHAFNRRTEFKIF